MAAGLSGAPLPPLFFDEDDDFGEFEFVSAPPPPPPQLSRVHHDYFRTAAPLHPLASIPNIVAGSGGQSVGGGDDGDEWGDFMESPIRLDTPSPVSPSPSHLQLFPEPAPARSEVDASKADKGWEKPTGAIPLSIFGEEEGEVEEPDLGAGSALPGAKDLFFSSAAPNPPKGGPGLGLGSVGIQDLLADLYGQAHAIRQGGDDNGEKASNGAAEGGGDDVVGHRDQDDDFDDDGWEFKAAVPNVEVADPVFEQDKDMGDLFSGSDFSTNGVLFGNGMPSGSFGEHAAKSSNSDKSMQPNFTNGHVCFDEKKFEVKDPILGSKDLQMDIDFFGSQDADPISNGKYQELDDLWSNHMLNLSTSDASNTKQEISEDIQPTSRSARSNGVISNNTTNFPDLLLNLYEEANKSNEMEKIYPKNLKDSANEVIDCMATDAQLFHDSNWYSPDAFMENRTGEETSLHTEIHQDTQIKSEQQKLLVSFYSDLRQVTYSMTLRHLENHKKAYDLAIHSGEDSKATELCQEIQETSAKLQVRLEDIENVAKDINFGSISLDGLLEALKHPQFQTLDRESSLSKRIALAEKEMGASCELYEHAISTLFILQSASVDEQQKYFIAWSNMLLACLQELQHGADIWTECVNANICTQILSEQRGCEFLFALGEIYRVSKVLHISIEIFKPWLLLNNAEKSDAFACSARCIEFWIDSRLQEVLENIPEEIHAKEKVKMLLESIKSMHDLSVQSLQNQMSTHVGPVCCMSLLPLGMLPDMKDVVWDGKSYFLKLANFWANRISSDPPNLPLLKIG